MEIFRRAYRRAKRFVIYVYMVTLAVILRRRIDIRHAQETGEGNFFMMSYQAKVSMPGRRQRREFLRATHDNNKLHKVALAIEIAEELCREFWLPATPVFIKAEGDTIVVLVKEN